MNRDGFSMIEVIVGMMIFVVGVLALASSTGFVAMQIEAADLRSERNVAVQTVTERMRAGDFDAISTRPAGDAVSAAGYSVWWDVTELEWAHKEITLYVQGPGYQHGKMHRGVVDTTTVRLARPIP